MHDQKLVVFAHKKPSVVAAGTRSPLYTEFLAAQLAGAISSPKGADRDAAV